MSDLTILSFPSHTGCLDIKIGEILAHLGIRKVPIQVLEDVFPGCYVFLCNVHVARYFKEKVFVSKGYWGDPNEKNYVNGVDREKLVAQICLVRDSPSEEIYNLREA